ncbi:MAG: PD-(D/E)XK nuclease family protein [Pirellulaceae bacterium]
MPISRKFLGWHQPPLQLATEYLATRYRSGSSLDLSQVQIIVPGSRAGRRLLELLVKHCEEQSIQLLPPLVETVGQFPERLYESKLPFACELIQQLTWINTLRAASRTRLGYLVPDVPEKDDFPRWFEIAQLIDRVHRELAAECLDFAGVLEGPWNGGADERSRWKLLASLQRRYLSTLDSLSLWDMQTARQFAIEQRECQTDWDIVLVGAADMASSIRRMLDQVATRVTALIFAPPDHDDWFDQHGCIVSEKWSSARVDLPFDRVRIAGGPNEQVEEVVKAIGRLNANYSAHELSVAVPDPALVPQIERRFRQLGLPSRYVAGKQTSDAPPVKLLAQLAAYLDGGRFHEFSGLVRHADLFTWINQRVEGDWLRQLDEYFVEHLQPELGRWLGPPARYELILAVERYVQDWLDPLVGTTRRLSDWALPLMNCLNQLYGDCERDLEDAQDHMMVDTFRRIRAALLEWQAVPTRLVPRITSSQAIELLVEALACQATPPLADSDAVEIVGWLEVPLDMAPVRIITSLNEGVLPTATTNDLFLPDGMRRALKLVDNQRRYARDAYAASVVVQSCPHTTWIVGRRDVHGDPMLPSRLLFATDDELVAPRVTAVFEAETEEAISAAIPQTGPVVAQFRIPRPKPLTSPITSMNITSFRAYLACPYRFYLRYVLGLQPLDDRAKEMDGRSFGNLLHQVLHMFGGSVARDETRAESLEKFLLEALEKATLATLGSRRRAPVNVQLKQMKLRLKAFARWQAERRRTGWEITHVEEPRDGQTTMDSGPYQMEIRGRIDRIDRHKDTGEWAILDYKSGDGKQDPKRVHMRGGRWVDLQLPLYRLIARPLGVEGKVQLGYIVLPKDTKQVGEAKAGWNEQELTQADAVAREVIASVCQEQFWPPKSDLSTWFDDFATICQEGVFERERFQFEQPVSTEEIQ